MNDFFPARPQFSALSSRLMEAHGWSNFLAPGLSESQQSNMLSALLRVEDGTIPPSRKIVDLAGAAKFFEDFQSFHRAHTRLSRHTARTTHPHLKEYVQTVGGLISDYAVAPSYGTYALLKENCGRHASRILQDLQEGDYSDELTGLITRELRTKLRESVAQGLSRIGTSGLCEEDSTHDHSKFIKQFEKEFELQVHRWEPLGDGVTIYLDQWNHDKMGGELPDLNTTLERLADKQGYLMLRRGQQSDIDFGSFPEPTSRWLFVQCTQHDDRDSGIKVISTTKYAPIPLPNE